MGMAVCLHARVAVRVLLQVGEIDATDGQACMPGARGLPWQDWLTKKSTLSVHAACVIRRG